ncbi:D-amino-acid oxidase [Stylophora pistillata]|uniref:D-amino-acid oxidase n=1 Tax=Stylophora pistillata TaxID=50429 RepID=A0A2B4SR93_STYPI|nr:D-amino-acid oxidase [Stylophora pistillata]
MPRSRKKVNCERLCFSVKRIKVYMTWNAKLKFEAKELVSDNKAQKAPRVLIIGGGVVGMTSALQLLNKGYKVTVLAKEYASPVSSGKRITSEIAGALWEWPPALCGRHTNEKSLERAKVWGMDGYAKFMELAMNSKETGAFLRRSIFYFKDKGSAMMPNSLKKLGSLNTDTGVVDAYQHMAPMVDTVTYMQWLYKQCREKGCHFVHDEIHGLLRDQAEDLKKKYKAQLIFNCSGLNAKELAGDEDVYPLRGVILKVRNDGSLMPKLNHSMCISIIKEFDESDKEGQSFVFILPRGDDKLWLGGMVQPHQWDRDLTLDYPPIRRMFEKVKEFYPPLRNYGDDDVEEVLVGLRPARHGNVRLEWDHVCPSLLHNYGHGGLGVTFSWGCAIEASAMVDRVFKRPQIYLSKL